MHAMNRRCTCQIGSLSATERRAAEGALSSAKYPEGRLQTSVGAIAFAVMLGPTPTAACSAQSPSRPWQLAEPPASLLPVKDQRVPVAAEHLRQLYNEITSRVGESYPR
jgi:hypothetical protein